MIKKTVICITRTRPFVHESMVLFRHRTRNPAQSISVIYVKEVVWYISRKLVFFAMCHLLSGRSHRYLYIDALVLSFVLAIFSSFLRNMYYPHFSLIIVYLHLKHIFILHRTQDVWKVLTSPPKSWIQHQKSPIPLPGLSISLYK